MELDDIKNIIQKEVPTETLSEDSFKKVKKWRSLHPAEKIRKKVLFENLLGLAVAMLALIFVFIYKQNIPTELQLIAVLIIAISIFYGFYKVYELDNLLKFSENTKDFLTNFNKAITSYIRILTITSLIMFPTGFYVGLSLGFLRENQVAIQEIVQHWIAQPTYFILSTVALIPMTYGVYVLIKIIYSKLYGKHIHEIDILIQELDEHNNH